MIRAIRRWLNRNPPLVCGICGWTAPRIGDHRDQADTAYDHWDQFHADEGEES